MHPSLTIVLRGRRVRVPRSEPTRPCKLSCNNGAQAVPKHRESAEATGPVRRGVAEFDEVRPQRVNLSAATRICSIPEHSREGRICNRSEYSPIQWKATEETLRVGLVKCIICERSVIASPPARVAGGLRCAPPLPYIQTLRNRLFLGASARPEPLNFRHFTGPRRLRPWHPGARLEFRFDPSSGPAAPLP